MPPCSKNFSTDAQEKLSIEKHLAEARACIVQGDSVKARRSFSKAIFTNPSVSPSFSVIWGCSLIACVSIVGFELE
jgi:hypothetical protein